MADIQIIWDVEDDPDGNVRHVAEHDISPEEFEEVLEDHHHEATTSRSSGTSHHLWLDFHRQVHRHCL